MSINTGNNFSIEAYRKLGLGSDISQITAPLNPFIPFNLYSIPTHKEIQKFQLSMQNDGTLKNYLPFFSIKKLENTTSNLGTQISEHLNYKINFQPNGFYTEIIQNIPIATQLSHNYFPKQNIRIQDNDFFSKFNLKIDKVSNEVLQPGINNNLPFARVSFPTGQRNTNTLNAFYYKKYTGQYSPTIIRYLNPISNLSGGLFISTNGSFRYWVTGNTSGYDNINYSAFYATYPTTLDQTTYNGYSIPTKISTLLTNLPQEGQSGVSLNGLMMISTGNGTKSKICYISPHGLKTGFMNSFVYAATKNSYSYYPTLYKGTSGIVFKGISLGTEYYTGSNPFPSTGIRYVRSGDKSTRDAIGYTGEISGFWRQYTIDPNQHLQQTTPIKDTLYYKFYSGLYTGNKTFNTGTWNGIIPSGTVFQIEYISCEFNKEFGCNRPFYIIYSGYGTLDQIDSKLTKFLSLSNVTGVTEEGTESFGDLLKRYKFIHPSKNIQSKSHPTYLFNDVSMSKIGRGVGDNKNISISNALIDIKYQFFNVYSYLLKTYIPEIIKNNRKYRRLQKFLSKK